MKYASKIKNKKEMFEQVLMLNFKLVEIAHKQLKAVVAFKEEEQM